MLKNNNKDADIQEKKEIRTLNSHTKSSTYFQRVILY